MIEPAIHALGVVDLRHEHAVGEAGCVAVAELPGRRVVCELPLDGLQAGLDPVLVPAVLVVLREAEILDQKA